MWPPASVWRINIILSRDNTRSYIDVLLIYNFDLNLGSNLLELVSLESYQMGKAICNDGTPAVYYRKPLNEASDTKKLLIYLKGGGMCVPNLPGHKCQPRCQGNNPLCTAATAPYYDPVQSNHGDDIFSPDPAINPAFYDYQYGIVCMLH